jgi:hydrophobic/amphiphilic exporter-1 (mainly G- bacteria), HAE1 family
MNGVDNMNYMYSLNAAANTTTSLIVDFDVKTDPNTDFILAQARETQAASQLPVDVTNYGITVRKSVTAPLMWVALYSPHGTYDANFLANYAYINLVDPILRSPTQLTLLPVPNLFFCDIRVIEESRRRICMI